MASRATPTIEITGLDSLAKSIQAHDRAVKRTIAGEMLYNADDFVSYAKKHAPWTDRSGNARSGLHAECNFGPEQNFYAEMVLAHSVFYGIWLEVRFNGKYAILMPTINHMGPILMRRIASAINALEGTAA